MISFHIQMYFTIEIKKIAFLNKNRQYKSMRIMHENDVYNANCDI